jgi:hypothetical protein
MRLGRYAKHDAERRGHWNLPGAFLALTATLGALALLAPAEPAEAKLRKAKFKLSVNGAQTTTFDKNETDCAGSGKEEVTFATPQPIKVTAALVKAEGSKAPFFNFGQVPPNGFGDPTFDVNATVHRVQTWTATAGCVFEDTGSCQGTAQAGWRLNIFGDFFEKNTIVIEDAGVGGDPLAESCPQPETTLGTYFPVLLSYDPVANRYLVKGKLSTKALFKKKKKKRKKRLNTTGQGSEQTNFFEETTNTSTNWTVELKRVR